MHYLLPGIGIKALQRRRGAGHASVVDQHIQPAQRLNGLRHDGFHGLALAYVADGGEQTGRCFVGYFVHFMGQCAQGAGIEVNDKDLGALAQKAQGHDAAYAAGACRD